MSVEVLIVGQGLAGTLLASALEDLGIAFVVIDLPKPGAASLVAAGIINPVTGRRYVKSWMYDDLVPVFVQCYNDLAKKINQQVLFPHHIQLCLSSVKEENDLLSQMHRYQYDDLASPADNVPGYLHPDIRSIHNISGYRLDIGVLLRSLRRLWVAKSALIEEGFIHKDLVQDSRGWQYHDIHAKHVVFGEGAAVRDNPFFKDLPVIGNKGQMLWIESEDIPPNASYKNQLVLSGFNQRHWVGATYEWKYDTINPTANGLEELKYKLSHIIHTPYTISEHLAGLRPTTADRRPIIAQHPYYTSVWALNGLGTKGSSIAPYLIKKFMPLLLNTSTINEFAPSRLKYLH